MHADGRLAKPMMARLTRRGMLRRSVQAWPAPHFGFCLPSIVRAWTGRTERADWRAEVEETRCNQTTRFHGVS